MAKLRPFKALRPVRDKAHLVAALPHFMYKRSVLKTILEVNPYLFLNIINPEYKSRIKTEPNSNERFEEVLQNYRKFKDEGVLIKDTTAAIYIYRQTKGSHVFTGVIAGASVDEYNNDLIKKHEATLTSREVVFTNYLDIVGYNAEPVLLTYSGTNEIDQLIAQKVDERAEYEFTTTDLNKHELWILNVPETAKMVKAFDKLDSVYIADGHHRSASSSGLKRLRDQRKDPHFPNEDFFLSFFIDEKSIQILEYNRLVRTLNNYSPDELLEILSEKFIISALKRAKKPSKEHDIAMCIENKWYMLTCKEEIIDNSHPVKCLDAEILTQEVLDPILGIKDLKSDANIDFISGIHPLKEINKHIKHGSFKIGFVLFPVSIDEIKRVADNKMIMPPKSTWVEPKLRCGLTSYNVNE